MDTAREHVAVLTCRLCGQPARSPVPSGDLVFCCHGCRDVWNLLGEEGVASLQRRGGGWTAAAPLFAQVPPPPEAAGAEFGTVKLDLEGLWCASCGILVEQVLIRTPGVLGAKVDFAGQSAEVALDEEKVSRAAVREAIRRLGYGARERDDPDGEGPGAELSLLRRFSVSAVLAVVVMMLSAPVWFGDLPNLPTAARLTLEYSLWVLATPVVFWGGWPFLRGAWSSVRHAVPTMDLLVATGSLSAYTYSVVSVLGGGRYLYFDAASMLIAFLLLSKTLEAGARGKTSRIVGLLSRLVARDAILLRDGAEIEVPVAALAFDDCIVVRPGRVIPVDGVVEEGESLVNESFLTGEAAGAPKEPGDPVYAGTVNQGGRLVVRAGRLAGDTILAQTAQYVKDAQAAQGAWKGLTDRVLRVFVPVVIGVAALSFAFDFWIARAGFPPAMLHAVATLVIACPCALSIAAPVAVLAGAQRLAQGGAILRSGDAIERAAAVDAVVFDKTGTLTTGRLSVDRMTPEDPENLRLAASAEWPSDHPAARALVAEAERRGLGLVPAEQFAEEAGRGVRAKVGGREVRVFAVDAPQLPDPWRKSLEEARNDDHLVSALEIDGVLLALFLFRDEIRPEAAEAVESLHAMGVEVFVASGDSERAVGAVSRRVGADGFRARLHPVDKAEWVRSLRQSGRRIAFVGDGINDAPALADADFGAAMAQGADIAREAGHIVLAGGDIRRIAGVLQTSGETVRVIRQNLLWALLYNVLAIPAAAAGFAYPAVAALAMVLSSGFVLGNALRILGWSPRRHAVLAAEVALLIAGLAGVAWFAV